MDVSVPLLLHGDLEAAVQDLVERVDPVLHLPLAVRRQQVGALILHLQLESEPPDLVVLPPQAGRRLDKRKQGRGDKRKRGASRKTTCDFYKLWTIRNNSSGQDKNSEQRLFVMEIVFVFAKVCCYLILSD